MRTILTLLIILCSFSLKAQNGDSARFESFRKFIPHLIEGINKSSTEIDNKVSEKFKKPWETIKISDSTAKSFLNDFASNANFILNSSLDSRMAYSVTNPNEDKLVFQSMLSTPKSLEEVEKRDEFLSRARILISEIEILDEKGKMALILGPGKESIESLELEIISGKIKTTFPINKEFKSLKGDFRISLKHLNQFEFKHLKSDSENVVVHLEGLPEPIEVIKFFKNRVYLKIPNPKIDYEITATDKEDKTFLSNGGLNVPLKIFEFAASRELSEKEIADFVKDLKPEDINGKPIIRIVETNGIIDNLYIYKNTGAVTLDSREIKLKL